MNKPLLYKDIFLDFDDTLYDTHGNADIALKELFADFNLGRYFARYEDFHVPYWQTNVELWTQYAAGTISRDTLILERFRRPLSKGKGLEDVSKEFCLEVSDHFLNLCADKPGVIKGAHELVEYLKGRGYALHMCSNGFHEVQYRKLKSCGMTDVFDNIILSEDAGANKPSREYFDYALRTTGAQRETTLMIGDNFQTDILGAKASGIDTLWFNPNPDKCKATEPINFEVQSLAEIMEIL